MWISKLGRPLILIGCERKTKAIDLLVLPKDVLITSVENYEPQVREQLAYRPNDYLVSRPHSRSRSLLVDFHAAKFLEEFRLPKNLVEAVINHSVKVGIPSEDAP